MDVLIGVLYVAAVAPPILCLAMIVRSKMAARFECIEGYIALMGEHVRKLEDEVYTPAYTKKDAS